jgi:NAD dependent epimerase/dehydratase family
MPNRRELIGHTAFAAAGLSLTGALRAAERPLDILFLGGTGFVGPHTVRAALSRGHRVTLFNRGAPMQTCFPSWKPLSVIETHATSLDWLDAVGMASSTPPPISRDP